MKRQIATLVHHGSYRVIFDDQKKTNPYSIVRIWFNAGRHQETMIHYADLASCMIYLFNIVNTQP